MNVQDSQKGMELFNTSASLGLMLMML